MALDLERTAYQLDAMMSGLNNFSSAHNDRLAEAVSVLKEFRREIFLEKTDSSSGVFQWTPPVFPENPSKSIK